MNLFKLIYAMPNAKIQQNTANCMDYNNANLIRVAIDITNTQLLFCIALSFTIFKLANYRGLKQ